ncbi:MAG: hypothetical protein AAGA57_03925 [Planctomycetota bacterium]
MATWSLVLALSGASVPALGQNGEAPPEPTAVELLESGRLEYEAGEFERAQRILRRIDVQGLSASNRDAYFAMTQDLEQRLGAGGPLAGGDPAEVLALGDELARSGDAAGALAAYQGVADSSRSSEAQKALAEARMQGVRRAVERDAAQVQRLLGSISEDLAAGRLADAEGKLGQLESLDVDLGWFDRERAGRLRDAVAVRRAEADAAERAAVGAAVGAGAGVAAVQLSDNDEPAPTAAESNAADAEIARFQGEVSQEQVRADLLRQAMAEEFQRELALAEEAFANGQFNVARLRAQSAVDLDPDNARAQQVLAQAGTAAVGGGIGQVSPIEQQLADTLLKRQKAQEAFNVAMSQARLDQQAGRFEAGRDSVEAARAAILQVGESFTQVERSTFLTEADTLDAQLAAAAVAKAETDAREAARISEQIAAQRGREADEQKRREVEELLIKARDLQRASRFDEAIAAVEQVRFIDPQNVTADILIRSLREQKLATDSYRLRDIEAYEMANQWNQNREASIPYPELLTYPKDWPSITQKRLSALQSSTGGSEADLDARDKLQTRVSVAFDGQALEGVIGFIRDRTAANIVVNWPALEFLGVTRDQPISIPVNNVPAERLLTLVLDQISDEGAEVSYSIRGGIITISTADRLREDVDPRVYDIRDLLVRVPNFPGPRLGLSDSGGEGGGGGLDFGDSNEEDDDEEDEELRQERIDDILLLIEETVGDQIEWGDLSTIQELNGQLIVKTTPENHLGVSALLAQLREQRAIQISVESRFLTVSNDFLDEFGIDLDLSWVGGAKFGPIALAQDSFSIGQRVGSSSFGFGEATPPTAGEALDPNTSDLGRSLILGASFIDDISVDLLVTATLANQRSTSLNAPRITFFNGQRANVQVITQFTYVDDVEPVPDTIGFDVDTATVEEGVVLDVEGTVSADRRYVTLTLRTQIGVLQQPIQGIDVVAGGVIGDGDTAIGGTSSVVLQLPEFDITLASATVSVPDRGTLLLGGQRLVTENEVMAGVPVLSKIPVINRLFTNSSTVREEQTLLILIKPTIIIQTEQEEEIFPGLTADPASFNLGR